MTQIAPLSISSSLDDPELLIELLEQYATNFAFAEEELARHRLLRAKIEEQQRLSEQTLAQWRAALAKRWEWEVAAQRLYMHIQDQLSAYFGPGTPHLLLVAPSNNGIAITANELLADLRRMEASLALMQPRPPFVAERLSQLAFTCSNLDNAIERTHQCEIERRSAVMSQRLTQNVYQRVCVQSRRLLHEHIGAA